MKRKGMATKEIFMKNDPENKGNQPKDLLGIS